MSVRMRSVVLAAVLAVAATGYAVMASAQRQQSAASAGTVEVYKSATCGCCSKWVEHMQAHGFTVRATNVDDLAAVKDEHRVPAAVESCHTAVVDGYVIEGHVPAQDVLRLLKERPAVAGIGARGMPLGSPGMEVEGVKPQPYSVLSFDKTGQTQIFARH